jgi:hypothetical protein
MEQEIYLGADNIRQPFIVFKLYITQITTGEVDKGTRHEVVKIFLFCSNAFIRNLLE